MKKLINFVLEVHRGEGFNLGNGEKSQECANQIHREAEKFRYYPTSSQANSNPIKELDEFYCKDERVPKIDLDVFGKDHIKEKEEQKFQ